MFSATVSESGGFTSPICNDSRSKVCSHTSAVIVYAVIPLQL